MPKRIAAPSPRVRKSVSGRTPRPTTVSRTLRPARRRRIGSPIRRVDRVERPGAEHDLPERPRRTAGEDRRRERALDRIEGGDADAPARRSRGSPPRRSSAAAIVGIGPHPGDLALRSEPLVARVVPGDARQPRRHEQVPEARGQRERRGGHRDRDDPHAHGGPRRRSPSPSASRRRPCGSRPRRSAAARPSQDCPPRRARRLECGRVTRDGRARRRAAQAPLRRRVRGRRRLRLPAGRPRHRGAARSRGRDRQASAARARA